jgi:hypothetical protein
MNFRFRGSLLWESMRTFRFPRVGLRKRAMPVVSLFFPQRVPWTEEVWWVSFAADVEARQHWSHDFRCSLLKRVNWASGAEERWERAARLMRWGGIGRLLAEMPGLDEAIWSWVRACCDWQETAVNAFIALGFLPEALASWRTLCGDEPSSSSLDTGKPQVTVFARWILGQEVPGVPPCKPSPAEREAAIQMLGDRAPFERAALLALLQLAKYASTPAERRTALWALRDACEEGNQEAITLLAMIARDKCDPVRKEALEVLGWAAEEGHSLALSALLSIAYDFFDPAWYRAAELLSEVFPSSAAYRGLLSIVQDPAAPGRRAAIRLLGDARWPVESFALLGIPTKQITKQIRQLLLAIACDPADPLRLEALCALVSRAGRGDAEVREAALRALSDWRSAPGSDDDGTILRLLLLTEDEFLFLFTGGEIHRRLLEIGREGRHPCCWVAIEVLGGLVAQGDQEALATLLSVAADRSHPERPLAIFALISPAISGLAEVSQALGTIAADLEDPARMAAFLVVLRGAITWGGPQARIAASQVLCSIARNPSDPARHGAITGLSWLAAKGDEEALSTLGAIASSAADPERETALKALRGAAIGGHKEALRVLVDLVDDRYRGRGPSIHENARGLLWDAVEKSENRTVLLELLCAAASERGSRSYLSILEMLSWLAEEGILQEMEAEGNQHAATALAMVTREQMRENSLPRRVSRAFGHTLGNLTSGIVHRLWVQARSLFRSRGQPPAQTQGQRFPETRYGPLAPPTTYSSPLDLLGDASFESDSDNQHPATREA